MRTGTHRDLGPARRPAVFAVVLGLLIVVGQAALVAQAEPPVDSPGPPSTDGVVPVIRDTRSSNDDCIELGFDHGVSIAGNGQVSGGSLTVTVSNHNSPTGFADWSSTQPIHGVYVKGGPSGGNLFSYPSGDTGDQDLHTPQKPDGGYYAVSHLAFCWNDVPLAPDVTVTKSNDPGGTVEAGGSIVYTLGVTNEGDGDATGVVVTDHLPPGVSLDSATAGCNGSAGTITCDVGDIGAGAHVDLTITVSVGLETCGPIANVASVEASNESGDATGNNGSNQVSNTVECSEPTPPDVQVTKTSSADGVLGEGDTFSYTITVTNVGEVAATGVSFIDALPEGEPLSVSLSPWPTFGGELCTIASSLPIGGIVHITLHCGPITLGPGESESITFDVIVTGDDCGPITNVVDVESEDEPAGHVGADNHAEVTDEVECAPRIRLLKGGPDLAHVGDTIAYAFAVTNHGSVDLTDIQLTDPMCDDQLQLVDVADGDATLSIGERWNYRCHRTITADDGDPVPNTATVRGSHDGGTVSDTDDHEVDVIHPAITIEKSASPTSGPAGTAVVYSYVVTNIGDTTLYDIHVNDDVLGPIGVIASLAPGATQMLTRGFTLGSTPVTNVGSASGTDVLGGVASADDTATVTVVAAAGGDDPGGAGSPFTGTEARGPVALAALLLVAGAALVIGTRKRSGATG
ncbi:MAG TPA: DUF11 domain-containing protein [Actinomycetota bacterium]|nr:DUF11 domain-containing protein [Actinomycetota bacterium]